MREPVTPEGEDVQEPPVVREQGNGAHGMDTASICGTPAGSGATAIPDITPSPGEAQRRLLKFGDEILCRVRSPLIHTPPKPKPPPNSKPHSISNIAFFN